jgi:hypothetical protein
VEGYPENGIRPPLRISRLNSMRVFNFLYIYVSILWIFRVNLPFLTPYKITPLVGGRRKLAKLKLGTLRLWA